MATPNCLDSRLTSFNHGSHCHITPAVTSLIHAIRIKNGLRFLFNAPRLDCKKRGRKRERVKLAILIQMAVMPRPNTSRQMSVWGMNVRCTNRWPSFPGP